MRFLLTALLICLAIPAFAQSGERYENARYGYLIDIPAGFVGMGESDNGDGQTFSVEGRPTELAVWGGLLLDGFEREVDQRMGWDEDEGWAITYQISTPRWASYSATKNGQILYQRLILLCDGTSYAAFQIHYSVADSANMSLAIEGMVTALRGQIC